MTGYGKRRLLTGTAALAAMGILQALARKTDGFGEWYATRMYPLLVGSVSRLLSPLPFSVAEFLLYGLILWLIVCLVRLIRGVTVGKETFRRALWRIFTGLYCLVSVLFLVYTVTCGINYYRLPFSRVEGFELYPSDNGELTALCMELRDAVNEAALQISLDGDGKSILEGDIDGQARQAMTKLGGIYDCLEGYYPRPKPLVVSKILAVQQLCGIYSPFTIEANYNREMPPYNIPFTTCHELSHLKGFMREDEANFIAFLACRNSDSPQFRYSGYLMAYVHASNALFRSGGAEIYQEVRDTLCDTAIKDLAANNAYWDRYDTKVAEVANNMNDTYLRANSQQDGVKSYGRMVDLLLADYRLRHQEN